MNLVIVGTGYVGLVSGTCFSEMGNNVICVDVDKLKIKNLKKGIIPIYEPGLKNLVDKNLKNKNLKFTTDIKKALEFSDVIFIAVGTPMGEDGSADLKYVLEVAKSIGENMQKDLIVVDKSTVPVGTADKVKTTIQTELDKRKSELNFHVVSNPEFLKEGAAISDFMKPDRVIIGTDNEFSLNKMKELYSPFCMSHERFIAMDVRSAEMTKYAANSMLATKISFMNEIANICELVEADANLVRIGIGSDSRIGYSFIYPGVGYGGSCFPKDVQALVKLAEKNNYNPQLINSVQNVNNNQKVVIVNKIIKKFGNKLDGFVFAVWGLSFKPGTDDMREAPSIIIISKLISLGAKVVAYDPKAIHEAKSFYLKDLTNISYVDSKYEALENSNALILLTEWKEFRSPDFNLIKSKLISPIIFDGRNQYSNLKLEEMGFEHFQIGKNS